MESAELIAILHEVRDRVRARNPQTAAGASQIALPDLLPLVHARDAAMGKVAAIGTVNPRPGGLVNGLIQRWKRLVARVLDWHVRDQVEFNRQVMACLDATIEALNDSNRALVEMGNQLFQQSKDMHDLWADWRAGWEHKLATLLQQLKELSGEFSDIRGHWADWRAGWEHKLATLLQQLKELSGEFSDIRGHWADWRAGWEHKLATNEMQFLRAAADLQGAFQHRVTLMDTSYREALSTQNADFHAALARHGMDIQKRLWTDLRVEYDRVIHTELRILRQRAQMGAEGLRPSAPEPAPLLLDYARFAERFRGSEEYVKNGQRFYLPYFEGRGTVLDIGCGRGEFLEMMREAGIPAFGIDLNEESVAACRLKGLEAEVADLFPYLADLPEASLGGIFCAQVVEHLPPERLPQMIQLCASRLRRDGALALETPNPECLAIFATHFYLDPTHTRPGPQALLAFYLEEFGIGNIEVRRLSPAVESMPSLGSLPEDFRSAFFGALDYAIIGRKL